MFTGAFCPLVFLALVSWLLGMLVFGPLYAKAIWKPPNTRFRIADIIILAAQLQVLGALAYGVVPLLLPNERIMRYVVPLVIWLLVAFWWWTGVRMLAKARVQHGPHRMFFMAVVLPLGYLATLFIAASPALIILPLGMFVSMITRGSWEELVGIVLLLGLDALMVCLIIGVRRYCQQMVDRAHDDVARDDGIEFGPLLTRLLGGRPLPRIQRPLASDDEVRILDEKPGS